MPVHKEPSQLAGKTVKIKDHVLQYAGRDFEVRDWWDRCSGLSWKFTLYNPICTTYAVRAGFSGRPDMMNDDVLYGRCGMFMHLIHVSELEDQKGNK